MLHLISDYLLKTLFKETFKFFIIFDFIHIVPIYFKNDFTYDRGAKVGIHFLGRLVVAHLNRIVD
jgi:phosphate starvation-inducible membrane PsiE